MQTFTVTHDHIDPIEILRVEDNEDDIILIEETFAEARMMNVITNVRTCYAIVKNEAREEALRV